MALYQVLESYGLRSMGRTPSTPRPCRGARRMCWSASGCKSCTPSACSTTPFCHRNKSACCAPTCGSGRIWWRRPGPAFSRCKRADGDERTVGQCPQRPQWDDGDEDCAGDPGWAARPATLGRSGRPSRQSHPERDRSKPGRALAGRSVVRAAASARSVFHLPGKHHGLRPTRRGAPEKLEAKADVAAPEAPRLPRRKHIPQTHLREELYRVTGVDVTRIDGIQVQTAQVVISEVGLDMTRWPGSRQGCECSE